MTYFLNNIPNIITIFRIFLTPIFFLFFIYKLYSLAFLCFFIASVSDVLDGYLARKYNFKSVLGEVLDPIADKILITFLIIALILELSSVFVGFVGGFILIREFWVAALRDFNARQDRSEATMVTFLAKINKKITPIET